MADVNDVVENDSINQLSESDQTIDYTELVAEDVFRGEYPLDTIIEGIENQFSSYMSTDDRVDYVDIFYEQYFKSIGLINSEDEDHPQEKKDAINKVLDTFIEKMYKLFEERLCITIIGIDDETMNQNEIEIAIRELYDFFILKAPETFRTVIIKDVVNRMKRDNVQEDMLDNYINDILEEYSPLVLAMTPMEFIEISDDQDIHELYTDSKVVGNFLKKFSPRLYANPEYEVSLINDIIIEYAMNNKEE